MKTARPKGRTLQQRFEYLMEQYEEANSIPYTHKDRDAIMRNFYKARDALMLFVWQHKSEIRVEKRHAEES